MTRLLILAVAVTACDGPAPHIRVIVPPLPGESRESEGGDGCSATGCSVEAPDAPASEEMAELLKTYAAAPVDESSQALDTLLFHGAHTAAYLAANGAEPLDVAHHRFLSRELGRTHVIVDMRVVDEHGVVRARLGERRVPIGKKTHHWFTERTGDLQSFDTSGTVVRVGLHHLWSRY